MRFYTLLLRLYPKSFRLEYGSELRSLLAARRRDAGEGLAVLGFWLDEIADLLVSAAQVHWDILLQDLGHARRSLGRDRGFALTAIAVTALGVGANTAVFSVTDRVLIRPLPFPDSERLVKVWESVPDYSRMEPSPSNYRRWQEMAASFEAMGAYNPTSVNLVGEGEPRRLAAAEMTVEVLPILGIEPLRGRVFLPEDDREGAPGTVLLSAGLWQTQFGAAQDIVGRPVRLGNETFTVIGVMPRTFSFPNRQIQLWLPLRLPAASPDDANNNYLKVLAKLAPAVTLDEARSEMDVVTEQLSRQFPEENANTRATVWRLQDEVPRESRVMLTALAGASLCVLLLACANLASLLLARALHRRRELSVRAALGAGPERLVRQLMTESLLLAGAGGVLGVLVAAAAAPLLAFLLPTTLPLDGATTLDGRVLAFGLVLAAVTGLGFGVVPALRGGAAGGLNGLYESTRSTLSTKRERLRASLVVAEIAAAVVLVISSGLLIRALWRVQAIDPGFRSANVLTLRTAIPLPRYEATEERAQLYERILEDVEALPGVRRAAYISFLPIAMGGGIWNVTADGLPADPERPYAASLRFVTPGFFEALDIPLRRGRDVARSDGIESQFVAVVSESFAERHWPGADPVGQRFEMAFAERIVVGVVGDIKVRGIERQSEPQVYVPYRQVADGAMPWYVPKDMVVRADSYPTALVPAIRTIVQKADPDLPVSDVELLAGLVARETGPRRAQLWILGSFSSIALLLAALGIHGLLSYTVSQRIPEIGVRVALGAAPMSILGLVAGDGARMALRGSALGLGLAYLAGRGMEALLAGVAPADAPTLLLGASLALLLTASGSLVAVRRALRVDPVQALRAEG